MKYITTAMKYTTTALAALLAANLVAAPVTLIPNSGDARCAIVVDPAVMAPGDSSKGLVNPALEAEKQRIGPSAIAVKRCA